MDAIFLGAAALYPIFLLLGLGFAWFVFGRGWASTLVLAPVVGLAATSLVVFVCVSLGYTVRQVALPLLLCGSGASLFVAFLMRNYRSSERAGTLRFTLRTAGASIAFLIAPMIAGGLGFVLLRGNASDYCNYVALSNYLQDEPVAWAQSASLEELGEKDHTFRFVARFGQARWVTKAILAFGSILTGIPTYLLFHSVVLLCFFLVGLGFAHFLRESGLSDWLSFGAGISVAAGFWAQVILDIQAFAHVNALPQLMLLLMTVSRFLSQAPGQVGVREMGHSTRHAIWGGVALLIVMSASLTLHYPELMPILGFGMAIWGLRVLLNREARGWARSLAVGASLGTGVALACWLQPSLITYCLGNARLVAQSDVANWYREWFPFLFREPTVGIMGLTPLVSYATLADGVLWDVARLAIRIVSVAGCLGLLIALANWVFRWVKNPSLDLLQSLALGCLLTMTISLVLKQRWTAAKAFSFGYPFYLANLVLFSWLLYRERPQLRFGWLKPAHLLALAGLLLLGQSLIAGFRVVLALDDRRMPNSVGHIYKYRQNQDWDMRAIQAHVSQNDAVGIALADPWDLEIVWNALRCKCSLTSLSPVPNWLRQAKLPEQGPNVLPNLVLMDRSLAEEEGWDIVAANRTFALVKPSEGARLLWWRRDWFAAPKENVCEFAVWSDQGRKYALPSAFLPKGSDDRWMIRVEYPSINLDGELSMRAEKDALRLYVKPGLNFVRIALDQEVDDVHASR